MATIEDSSDDTLVECLHDPARVSSLSRETARRLWLQVKAVEAHLMLVWCSPDDSATDESVLTVKDAATYARVSESFLYDNAKRLPCGFRAGRAWRFRKKDLLQDIAALGDDRQRLSRAFIEFPAERPRSMKAGVKARAKWRKVGEGRAISQ